MTFLEFLAIENLQPDVDQLRLLTECWLRGRREGEASMRERAAMACVPGEPAWKCRDACHNADAHYIRALPLSDVVPK